MDLRRYIYILLASTVMLVSCAGKKEKQDNMYEHHGISFAIPAGWKVTADTERGEGTLVNVEKQGTDESGLASIAIVDNSHDLQNMVTSAQLQTKNSFNNLGGSFEAEQPVSGKLNGYESVSSSYKAVVRDVPHTGMMYAFKGKDKCVLLILQEADEDHADNQAGMETLKNSIKFQE